MPKFKKNPNPIMKKGPFKMKYKHSAFPFKSSPAKEVTYDWEQERIGGIDTSQQTVPSHSHSEMGGGGGGAATSDVGLGTMSTDVDFTQVSRSSKGRRTIPGQV